MELRRQSSEFLAQSTTESAEAIHREIKKGNDFTRNAPEHTAARGPLLGEPPARESSRGPVADQVGIGPKPQRDLSIGVVVPVLNESKALGSFLSRLYEVSRGRYPVVVVDGGSSDDSGRIARQFFHTETISVPNRGMQLNHGARCLLTDVLLFLHADSELPRGFDFHVRVALADQEVVGGCFRLEFDAPKPLLNSYAWFTKSRGGYFHYGDQGFFIRRGTLWQVGGVLPLPTPGGC